MKKLLATILGSTFSSLLFRVCHLIWFKLKFSLLVLCYLEKRKKEENHVKRVIHLLVLCYLETATDFPIPGDPRSLLVLCYLETERN